MNTISWGATLYRAQNNASLVTGEWWSFTVPGEVEPEHFVACHVYGGEVALQAAHA